MQYSPELFQWLCVAERFADVMLKVISTALLFLSSRLCSETHCGEPIGYGSPVGTRKDRIVGGYDLGFYKYPWYVALISDKIIGCGGSLINSRTVLTAAHCFNSKTKLENQYVIKLGVYNICTTESTQIEFKAEKVTIHELYPKKNPYYDIALITLKGDASQFTPICLPKYAITKRPREGLVPGLGVLKYDGNTPCTLQESRLLIHPDAECRSMLSKVEKNISRIINSFCAGYIQGGIDTCQGDSGGPLQIISNDGRYTLLGIVSFGYKCAAPGVLGLYTDVSKYLGWIKKHSGGVSSNEHDNTVTDQTNSEATTEASSLPVQTPASVVHPMPTVISVGSKPNQFLQFYPMRPVSLGKPSNSPINIFIFNRKNSRSFKLHTITTYKPQTKNIQ